MPHAGLRANDEVASVDAMQLTDANFQRAIKVGGLVLALCVFGNLYFLLRYREVYRDATQADAAVQQLVPREQILENVIREFAGRAASDPGVAGIFKRHQTSKPAVKP